MELPGIVETVRLAATVVLALPLVLFGLQRTVAGDPLGLGFVALGAVMVGIERVVTNPLDPMDLVESGIDAVSEYATGDEERRR